MVQDHDGTAAEDCGVTCWHCGSENGTCRCLTCYVPTKDGDALGPCQVCKGRRLGERLQAWRGDPREARFWKLVRYEAPARAQRKFIPFEEG
jgi:hypothetical protein